MLSLSDDGVACPAPVFEVLLPVRWSDLDADGRVNNVLLLKLAEEARMRWAAALDLARLAPDRMPVLASTAAVYRKPVRYPAQVVVSIACSKLGHSSLHLQFELRDAADRSLLHAQALAVWVWVDRASEQPVPMPERLREVCTAR
ncbi:acyl-CoA thioesterase [Xylophilus sp. GOD-11R]|uniref:acyl-CoA thioesterase n=1 Tax=Xylophilus sp. GOD-11R TaxID=3089814 RepID=UPI00298C2931|nr:acyl-CoA thioesterase [Xylophilus sp. GOD-11R]WPB59117.1 acyl-CoA thioesterase [Xylophilus sp. GOD-11R]